MSQIGYYVELRIDPEQREEFHKNMLAHSVATLEANPDAWLSMCSLTPGIPTGMPSSSCTPTNRLSTRIDSPNNSPSIEPMSIPRSSRA